MENNKGLVMFYKNFTLLQKIIIKNPKINITDSGNCFLYQFYENGIGINALQKWLNGKIIDIYKFTGRFGKSTKCPWCDFKKNNLKKHIRIHNKSINDIETIKLSNQLYGLLLLYIRNGNYDALSFLVKRSCQYCITPIVNGRENKCAIPESSRNKPRSLKILGFKCKNFNINNYTKNDVAIIYQRRPYK